MKISRTALRTLKPFVLFCILLFPLFWIVLGGKLRTPLLFAGGSFAIYLLWLEKLHRRLGRYGRWALPGLLLAAMGFCRPNSEPLLIPVWHVLTVFYCVPVGIYLAHCTEESEPSLNAIFAGMMLLFGFWGLLVMRQIDLTSIVRMTQEVTTRLEQRYPVELFGIFSWDNVKMQLIPWCVYPLGAVVAVACRNSWVTKGMLLAGAALAVYVAGAFLTRTVFLSGGIAIAVAILLFMIKADRKRQFMMVTIILLLFLGVLELIQIIPAVHDSFAGLQDRFSGTADDSRKYLWESSAKLMVQNPMGGGDALLEDHLWAHNLPLDMGLLYGIPGFLCMSWLLIMLSHAVVKWAGRMGSEIRSIEVLLLSMFLGAIVSCLVCPPDLALLTPMLFAAAFAKERTWIAYSRSAAIRSGNSLTEPYQIERLGLMTRHRLPIAMLLAFLAAVSGAHAAPHPSLPAAGTLDGLGVNIHFTRPKPGEMEMIAASGCKWIRTDILWESIEKQNGKYDFSAYDTLVAALDRFKLHALFVLDYGNRLYSKPGDAHPYDSQQFRDAYARWVVATVTHYRGRGVLWEIWNEPNLPTFWKPIPSEAAYTALASTAAKALRNAGLCADNHSGEALIGPACSTFDVSFLEACFKAGLLNYWCAVSVHPYRNRNPETVVDDYRLLRTMIATYAPGAAIPIICGEWGYSTADTSMTIDGSTQASFLARGLLTNIANDVPLSIWYDWRDDGNDPKNYEQNFGMVKSAYKGNGNPVYDPKPAYAAMKTLCGQLAGFTFNKQVSLPAVNPDSDVVIELFARGMDTRAVAWLDSGAQRSCRLPVANCVLKCVNTGGEALPDQTVSAASSTVALEQSPVYFTPAAPDRLLTVVAQWQKAPLDIPCDAPAMAEARLNLTNPLSQPIMLRGMSASLAPSATVQTRSGPFAPARMPLDKYGELDGHIRKKLAYLDLLEPRCLVTQSFAVIVRNYINLRLLAARNNSLMLEVENPSRIQWNARISMASGSETGLSHAISVPGGAAHQYILLPAGQFAPRPKESIQLAAEGGMQTLPAPVPLPWKGSLQIAKGGDQNAGSTLSLSQAAPPDGGPPTGTESFEIKYHFDRGGEFLRVGPAQKSPPIEGLPDMFGLWLYGDGQNCIVRGRFSDASNQSFQVDAPKLTDEGWHFVTIPITGQANHWGGANDGQIHYPITWDWLLIEGSGVAVGGAVYFSAPVTYSKTVGI